MTLSLILCSRNDNYQGNSRWRLETALNYVGERVAEIGRSSDVEVIVVDWGSDVPLSRAIRLRPAAARIASFLHVPPAIARKRQRDSPFPEVLALNAAARRAKGAYIGRIDQDTLVGARFLDWIFSLGEDKRSLFFANRRAVPYRFVERSPGLSQLTTFVRTFGASLDVWRQNVATGHVFWTSYVGIWLAHRDLWDAAGGYDERLIYYNWMETDMICRLRAAHPVVDLGALTGHDFYHLEHNSPRAVASKGRPHGRNNPVVDLAAPAPALHPNGREWGLSGEPLSCERVAHMADAPDTGAAAFAWLVSNVTMRMALDRAAGFATARVRRIAGRWHPRKVASALLSQLGLLGVARRARLRLHLATDPEVSRLDREDAARFERFSSDFGQAVSIPLAVSSASAGTALVVSARCPTIEAELCVLKGLELTGFRTVVLLEDERRALKPFYELAGASQVRFWSEFVTSRDHARDARNMVGGCGSVEQLMTRTENDIRVGMIATCTALRRMRVGQAEWHQPRVREQLVRGVAASMSAAAEARSILDAIRPQLVLTPPEYTPHGELFETCLARGIDTVAYDGAHRTDALVFKRYTAANRDRHLTTLSPASWRFVRDLDWTSERQRALACEVDRVYKDGDWYSTPWAADAPADRVAIRRSLGLREGRPAAFVFPHMLWDAPVMWGTPLFRTYQDWFVETVETACGNPEVDWVIKIHPAHVWKQADERYSGDSAEIRVLKERIGDLPSHIHVLPPDTPINTLSLFAVMDYCITVRGTVGVEAARFGVPVLTAGPARYSELGFTVDSRSKEDYLARVATIQDIPKLSDHQRELAERFAYGLFLLRPLKLESVRWQDSPSGERRAIIDRPVRLTVSSESDWRNAPDVNALARWLASRDEDFLNPA